MESEFWAAITGAVLGSVVSGGISYALARQANEERKRIDAESKEDAKLAMARRVNLKVKLMVDEAYTYFTQVRDQLPNAWPTGGEELAVILKPIHGGLNDGIKFEIDEMAFLLSISAGLVMSDLVILSLRQATFRETMAKYGELRERWEPHIVEAEGGRVTIAADDAVTAARLRALMYELGETAMEIKFSSYELYRDGLAQLGALAKEFSRAFPKGGYGKITIDPERNPGPPTGWVERPAPAGGQATVTA